MDKLTGWKSIECPTRDLMVGTPGLLGLLESSHSFVHVFVGT
jgi:hypothetical protein